ncbi:MAG: CGNR zinc finger domain-containing protein [Myxococcales bacterium]
MTFSFHRGSLALDLAGTLGSRSSGEPEERMPKAEDLGRWLVEAGLLERSAPTGEELAQAHALREAIYQAGADVVQGRPVRRFAVEIINRAALGLRLGAPQLSASLATRWEGSVPVAVALGRVAADAIEVLSHHADRLARCQLAGCGALLLSRSRGEARRWCSMDLCGNRAKVAAFRRRKARAKK